MAVSTGLWEAFQLNLQGIMAEGDSLCAIKWDSGRCKPPWRLADVAEEIWDHGVLFHHVKRSANSMADMLAKVGLRRPSLDFSTNNVLLP